MRVKDIARIDLGAQTYNLKGRLNGQPAAILACYQLPGTNAVKAAQGVRQLMAEAKQRFPADMDYAVSLDQTLSVAKGLREILKTLFEALALVVLVVFIFLQNWRATLIPLCAVPVSLIGVLCFSRSSGFRSTRFHFSVSCSRSVWWSMTRLSWSKPSNVTLRKAWRRVKQRCRRCAKCPDRSSALRLFFLPSSFQRRFFPGSPDDYINNSP